MRATAYICLVLGWGMALAQGSLEVIELRHATADRVIPVLRPLLEPGAVLTGQRSRLIVRTSPQNLAELRRALEAIDRPARRLIISVRFDGESSREESGIAVDARVSNRGSRIELRGGEAAGQAGERVDQRLQVLEGGRAFVATGSSRPLAHRDGAAIQDIATGFEVVPRVAGDEVILEVAPHREVARSVAQGGGVRVERAATTVRARLGEWVELAGVDEAGNRADRGALSASRSVSASSRHIWVRVDEARP